MKPKVYKYRDHWIVEFDYGCHTWVHCRRWESAFEFLCNGSYMGVLAINMEAPK